MLKIKNNPFNARYWGVFDSTAKYPEVISQSLILAFLIWFFMLHDGFGLDSQFDKISRDYGGRLISEFNYPEGDSDVRVVLFDENYVEAHGGWPPRFKEYSWLLEKVFLSQPKSVTIDILIGNKPDIHLMEGYDGFLAIIEAYKSAGIPLLFGFDKEAAVADFYQDVSTTAISWSGHEEFYPYSNDDGLLTPAFTIYEGLLDNQLASNDDIFVIWARNLSAKCKAESDTVPAEDYRWYNFSCHQSQSYIPGVTVGDLLADKRLARKYQSRKSCGSSDETDPLKIAHCKNIKLSQVAMEALNDKHIIIGADITGLDDHHATPVDGNTPGVYFHAMALDNLLKLGNDYYKPAEEYFGITDIGTVIELVAIALNLMLFVYAKSRITKLKKPHRIIKKSMKFLLISLLIILSSCFVVTYIFKYAPSNILGLLAVDIVIIYAIEKMLEASLMSSGKVLKKNYNLLKGSR